MGAKVLALAARLRGEQVLEARDTAFGPVVVTRKRGWRLLRTGMFHVQTGLSEEDPDRPAGRVYGLAAASISLAARVRRVLALGLGGGWYPAYAARAYPSAEVVAVDANPAMEELARKFFGLPDSVRVVVADALDFVRRAEAGAYDAVFMDIFRGMSVPGHLRTPEFFRALARVVAPGGVVCVNVVRRFPGDPSCRETAASLKKVFPYWGIFDFAVVPPDNVVLFGATSWPGKETVLRVPGRRQAEYALRWRKSVA